VPETLPDALNIAEAPAASNSRSRLLARVFVGALLGWLLVSLMNEAGTLLIRHTRLGRSITSHLETAFGRSVEVGNYRFTLWAGPEVVAEDVTVSEDPRFGNEYFLRAESLSARMRLAGLLRGHLVLGRVLLTRPSLNLVRNETGDWNFEEWLPRPENSLPAAGFSGPVTRRVPGFVLNRIEVDGGRINVKIGDEKLPFALIDVDGFVEPDAPGQWRLDLTAAPLRAPVVLQQPGVLRLAGEVGGTSSRLRPANLQFYWSDASVSDLLRLARNDDEGIRGMMGLEVDAKALEDVWTMSLHGNVSGLHRWDLAARSDNPSLAVRAELRADPAKSLFQIADGAIEAPHSHLGFTGVVDWARKPARARSLLDPSRMTVEASEIGMPDILAWIRAFRPDVASDISLQGTARVRMESRGWPPHFEHAVIGWDHGLLTGPRLRVPIHLSAGGLEIEPGRWGISPTALSFGDSDGSLRMETTPRAGSRGDPSLEISGQIMHVRDLISSAAAFGWVLSRGWDLEGPLRCDMRWPAGTLPWHAHPQGSADWGTAAEGASLQTPFLNQPVEGIRAHADWKPDVHTISLAGAEAFGARWNGTLQRRETWPEWQFDLSADHLAAADLDRWLDPRWKRGFLDRLLPFLNPLSPAIVMPENLGASGTLDVAQFSLGPVVLHKLEGGLSIQGRTLELSGARAQMYGGEVSGSLLAELRGTPRYATNVKLARVDLGALSASLPGQSVAAPAVSFSGVASGDLTMRAQGTDRASLAASLGCQGAWDIQDPEIRGINLGDSLTAGTIEPGMSSYRSASVTFSCGNGRIRIPTLTLAGANQEFEVSGSVDYSRNAALRVRVLPLSKMARVLSEISEAGQADAKAFTLSGNLSTLTVQPATSPSSPK